VRTTELTPAHKRLLAYAHPLRERIFTRLTEESASPSQLTRALGLARRDLPNVANHVKKLVDLDCAELVDERTDGPLPEKVYKATARALVETAEWEDLRRENPAFAEYQVSRAMQVQIDDFVLASRGETVGDDENFHLTRTRRVLDAPGLLEALAEKERSRRAMDEIERRSAERRSQSGEDAIPVSDGLALFRVPFGRSPNR
jgi:hypothetical protein